MTCMGPDSVLLDWKIKFVRKGEYRVGQTCSVAGAGSDANRLLGIVPAGETERKYRDVLYWLSHLKTYEQNIVLRTAGVLADELRRNR